MTTDGKSSLRVCVVTSYPGAAEPRAPRHAGWIAEFDPSVRVVFVDSAPTGEPRRPVRLLDGCANIEWQTHAFATRVGTPIRLVVERLWQSAARALFKIGGTPTPAAVSARAVGLERRLVAAGADIYLAHNSETLLPAWRAARRHGALLMFDSMEFHSDMGDAQTPVERQLVRAIERRCLPDCALVLAASDQISDALEAEYSLPRPLALYNVPPIEPQLADKPVSGLALYWRNSVVGLGQRGLEDALRALRQLPDDVTLHLQGRLPADGGTELRARIAELGVAGRVRFHPPYVAEDAVREAARHHVGLCMERTGCRNHELTVSNKIFDYHMAGLAVVASDLPGLRAVIDRSGGGLLYRPGSPEELAERIRRLRDEPGLRESLAGNAREFALREGNREVARVKFREAFAQVCRSRLGKELEHDSKST